MGNVDVLSLILPVHTARLRLIHWKNDDKMIFVKKRKFRALSVLRGFTLTLMFSFFKD